MEKKFNGKTFDEAKMQAYKFFAEYGVDDHDVNISIIEQPVKKLFGTKGEYIISASAAVSEKPSASAPLLSEEKTETAEKKTSPTGDYSLVIGYLSNILNGLGANGFKIDVIEKNDATVLDIIGDNLGIAIGRRGETLDSLQYLAVLANNRRGGQFKRISVDCNGYREKRRETLETLANRTANKVLKQGRRITLEPMNPYERRIIHSTVAEIQGVFSNSIGDEPFRKVVISANVPKPRDRRDDRRGNSGRPITPGRSYKQSSGFQTSFERDYKRNTGEKTEISQDTVDFEKNASFGKIDI